jgi:hypothetical protein
MPAVGVYDQIKKAFQDIVAPELHGPGATSVSSTNGSSRSTRRSTTSTLD